MTTRERVLAAMSRLNPAGLLILATIAERLARRHTAAPVRDRVRLGRCSWTARGIDGRVRCCLDAGHPGEHLWRRP